MTLEFE